MRLLTSQIANFIIDEIHREIENSKTNENFNPFTVTAAQLHKMVYVVYAYFALITEQQLTTELPKISKDGPYFEDLRAALYGYDRYNPIKLRNIDPLTEEPIDQQGIPKIVEILAANVFTMVKENKILCSQLTNYLKVSDEIWGNVIDDAQRTGEIYMSMHLVRKLIKQAIVKFTSDKEADKVLRFVA